MDLSWKAYSIIKLQVAAVNSDLCSVIVADLYLNPLFPRDTKHVIHSCTKSIISILSGIAVARGYIERVEVPVLEIFEEKKISRGDSRLQALTLQDLLTMQTGLRSRDSYLYEWEGLFATQASDDWWV